MSIVLGVWFRFWIVSSNDQRAGSGLGHRPECSGPAVESAPTDVGRWRPSCQAWGEGQESQGRSSICSGGKKWKSEEGGPERRGGVAGRPWPVSQVSPSPFSVDREASHVGSHSGALLGPDSKVRQCFVWTSVSPLGAVSSASDGLYCTVQYVSRSVFISMYCRGWGVAAGKPCWTGTWRRIPFSLCCGSPAKLLKFWNVLGLSSVISKNTNSRLWMKAGLRLILFLGCDPEAATESAFLPQIWQRSRTVFQNHLSLFSVSPVSGQVWNIALFLHGLDKFSACLEYWRQDDTWFLTKYVV